MYGKSSPFRRRKGTILLTVQNHVSCTEVCSVYCAYKTQKYSLNKQKTIQRQNSTVQRYNKSKLDSMREMHAYQFKGFIKVVLKLYLPTETDFCKFALKEKV